MSVLPHWLPVLMILLAAACSGSAAEPPQNPIDSLLFPPELLLQNRQQLQLTDKQVQTIQTTAEDVGPQLQQLQQQADAAMGQFAEVLSAADIEEQQALQQLDAVLEVEQQLKRQHLTVMLRIRNALTPEQRQLAAGLQQEAVNPADQETRLKSKLAQVQQAIQSRAGSGQPPYEAVGLMQKFPELMKNGQVQQAEALLDRVLALLGRTSDSGPAAQPQRARLSQQIQQIQQALKQRQERGQDVSEIRNVLQDIGRTLQQNQPEQAERLMRRALELAGTAEPQPESAPPAPPRPPAPATPDENDGVSLLSPQRPFPPIDVKNLQQQVRDLQVPDVAWRQIGWKTCLLEGLRASREQHKPVMLWIFIDRPIDDERC